MIDAMAHELKTPLTSIRAATSALLANPAQNPANAARMLKIADEEAARLEELIDNALDIAQLDSDRIDLDLEISSLNDAVHEVVASLKTSIAGRPTEIDSDSQLPPLALDRRFAFRRPGPYPYLPQRWYGDAGDHRPRRRDVGTGADPHF
jgi:two-component system sensor histidine kinase KdpD